MSTRAIALISLIIAPAACTASSGGSGSAAHDGGQLVWAKPAEVDVLDPTAAGDATAWEMSQMIYEGLIGLDADLKPVPKLARAWQQTSPTTYVFTLRKNVRFSNGREMTPDDVAGSLERVMDPKLSTYWAGQLDIEHAEANGPDQVKVTLTKPKTSFVAALGGSQAVILPMKELRAGTFDPNEQLLGTGPYKVTAHVQNESWTLDRNPYYWRPGIPKASRLLVRIMPDEAARTAALRDGSVDVTTYETPDSLRLLKGQANITTVVQPTTDYYRIDVNAKGSIFTDDRLRQALALSVDREKIRDVALAGVGRPTAAISPAFHGVCDPGAMPFGVPDLNRARRLVAAAGATGRTVQIISLPIVPMSASIAQVLQQNLRAVGLKARITPVEIGELTKRYFSGKISDFHILVSWYAGYGDPAMILPFWNPAVAQFNKGFLKTDAVLNTLIDASTSTPPGPKRTAAMRTGCERVAQDANVIPLVSKDAIIAYRSDKVVPVIPGLEGYGVPLRHMAEFTLK